MKATIPIWVVTVTHKHGHDTYLAGTKREAYTTLDQYVSEWWDSEIVSSLQKPKAIRARIARYFSHTNETYEVLAHQVTVSVPIRVNTNANT